MEALALKYRPIDFASLVGQEAVSRTLSLALDSKRLSHAYLFSGLRGSGKTSSARIFARALECDKGPCSKPCGVCPNCIAANPHKMRHIDIMELDGASNRKIDDIRDLIEQTRYHPNLGRFKIFIIDEVHMLTREAFNALLKTLEEPPEYVKFILATTDPLKLPATILSRTQHFRFKRISDKSIFEHLKKILEIEQIVYEDEALNMLIRSGAGSLRDTLTLLDQAIIYSNYHVTTDACATMLGLINAQSLNTLFDAIFSQNRQMLLKTLEGFFEYECEMLLDEMNIFLKNKLLKGDDTRYSSLVIDRFFRIIAQAKELLFLGSENSFVLTLSAFKMLEALNIERIEETIANLEKGFFEQLPKPQVVKQEIPQNVEPTDHARALYALLEKKIYAHNYDLGEIFAKDVRFISYENNVLTWETLATGTNRDRLRNAYPMIKNYAIEVFGLEVQLKNITKPFENMESQQFSTQTLKEISQNIENQESQNIVQNTPKDFEEDPIKAEVTQALNSPLLKSAQDLLEIRQVKVRPIAQGQ